MMMRRRRRRRRRRSRRRRRRRSRRRRRTRWWWRQDLIPFFGLDTASVLSQYCYDGLPLRYLMPVSATCPYTWQNYFLQVIYPILCTSAYYSSVLHSYVSSSSHPHIYSCILQFCFIRYLESLLWCIPYIWDFVLHLLSYIIVASR
jgi:hypothetical protein